MTKPDDSEELQVIYQLDEKRFPNLALATQASAACQIELRELLDELRPPRSVRTPKQLLAKLIRQLKGQQVEESVIVREISQTGIVIEVPQHLQLELVEACHPRLWLQGNTGDRLETLETAVTLVRLVELREKAAVLAFRFDDINDAQAALLSQLSHWRGARA